MGLAENVSALATRVATEIKAVRTELAAGLRGKQPSAKRWTDWRLRTSGQTISNTTVSDDGTAFYISPQGTETATTANNRLEVSWPNSTGGALYIQQNTGGTVKRIGASFGFGPSANATSGSFALATWTTDYPTPGTTAAQVHLAMTASSATFGVVVAGTVTNLVTWPYVTTIAQDWTPYYAEVIVVGTTAHCSLPDGTSRSVTDSRIGSTAGYTACWEFFRDAATTTVPLAFYEVWASTTGAAGGLASRGTVARIADTTTQLAIANYRLEDAADNQGDFKPVDHGLLAWTSDPMDAMVAYQPPSNGALVVTALKVDATITCTSVNYAVTTAGATFTASRNFIGLYSIGGTSLLRQTADLGSVMNTATLKTTPWSAGAITLTPGVYYVGIITTATTRPILAGRGQLVFAGGANTPAAIGRIVYRAFVNTTAYTALPAALPAPTVFPAASPWFALS